MGEDKEEVKREGVIHSLREGRAEKKRLNSKVALKEMPESCKGRGDKGRKREGREEYRGGRDKEGRERN